MKYAVVFIIFGLTCAFFGATSSNLFSRIVLVSSAVAFSGVGLGYGFLGPKVFLKKSDGRLNFISYILYWPYYLINILSLFVFRHSGKENAYDKIDQSVYLGCRLSRYDKKTIAELGVASVLDLTCEFSEIRSFRRLCYCCIPVLDTRAPTLEQLNTGAQWIKQQSVQGPVYVHCALGHGRSATFVAAYLLLSGKALTAQEATAKIAALRPQIGLSASQMSLLHDLEAQMSTHKALL